MFIFELSHLHPYSTDIQRDKFPNKRMQVVSHSKQSYLRQLPLVHQKQKNNINHKSTVITCQANF